MRNATDLVMYQCDSHENVKEFVMMSPHVMLHPIVSRITNMNLKCEHEPEMQMLKQMRLLRDVHEPMKHHDTSRHVT